MMRRAIVTGASSGIGWATAAALRGAGWEVVGVARRAERLERLAADTGADAFAADLTQQVDVDALAEYVGSAPVHSLVHIAGGALGADRVEDGDSDDWLAMYERNTLSAQRLTKALLPQLRRTAADGDNTMTRHTWSSGLLTRSRLHPHRDPDGPAHEGELMLPISLALPAASTAR